VTDVDHPSITRVSITCGGIAFGSQAHAFRGTQTHATVMLTSVMEGLSTRQSQSRNTPQFE